MAKRRNRSGALAAYTAAIDSAEVTEDVQAMALYNRALVYVANGDNSKGINDLDRVLAMDGAMAMVNVQTMARQKLTQIEAKSQKRN